MLKREMKFVFQASIIFALIGLGAYGVFAGNLGSPGIVASSSGGGTAADPSQSIDGTVHNGVLTTFMRSDAAPALASGVTLTAPVLGTPASGNLSNCTSTSMVLTTPILGTPTSGTLTNCTGYPNVTAQTGTPFLTTLGSTGASSASGIDNTAVGYQALNVEAAGTDSTGVGFQTGLLNTAVGNTFVGSQSGTANTTSTGQAFFGYQAGKLVTGADNSIFGYQAGDSLNSGVRNSLFGRDAGGAAGAGGMVDCTFLGYQTGLVNTASSNVFIGSSAGATNTSGTGQCFVGTAAGATVTGNDNTIFGYFAGDAFTTGARNSLFGKDAGGAAGATSMSDSTFLGYQTGLVVTGNNNTLIGSSCGSATLTSGTDNIGLGKSCVFTNANGQIAIGSGATTTAANQFVAGASAMPATDVYFGKGVTSTTSTAWNLHGTGGSGADNAGGALLVMGGAGTGTAKGGNVIIQTSPAIATSSTAQTLRDRYIAVAKGTVLTDATPVTLATITLGANAYAGGRIICTVQCTNGTDQQAFTQIVEWSMATKAGTYTTAITASTGAKSVTGGSTIANTWTITAAGAIQLSSDTSLTPSGTNSFVAYYSIENHSEVSVTLP